MSKDKLNSSALDVFAKGFADGKIDFMANSLRDIMPILCGDQNQQGFKCLNETLIRRLLQHKKAVPFNNAKRCVAVVLLHCLEHRGYAKYLDMAKDFESAFSRGHYITKKIVVELLTGYLDKKAINRCWQELIVEGIIVKQQVAKELYADNSHHEISIDYATQKYLNKPNVRRNDNFDSAKLLEVYFVVPNKFVQYVNSLEYSKGQLAKVDASFIQLISLNPIYNRFNRTYLNSLPDLPTLAKEYPRVRMNTTENKQYPAAVPKVLKPFEFPDLPRKKEEDTIAAAMQATMMQLNLLDSLCEKK